MRRDRWYGALLGLDSGDAGEKCSGIPAVSAALLRGLVTTPVLPRVDAIVASGASAG